jgi:hypothetical protein
MVMLTEFTGIARTCLKQSQRKPKWWAGMIPVNSQSQKIMLNHDARSRTLTRGGQSKGNFETRIRGRG